MLHKSQTQYASLSLSSLLGALRVQPGNCRKGRLFAALQAEFNKLDCRARIRSLAMTYLVTSLLPKQTLMRNNVLALGIIIIITLILTPAFSIYAAPPPLPQIEDAPQNEQNTATPPSLLDKLKLLIKRSPHQAPKPQDPNASTENANVSETNNSFIDLGDTKLPSLNNNNQDTTDSPTFSTPETLTQDSQDASAKNMPPTESNQNNTDQQQTSLPTNTNSALQPLAPPDEVPVATPSNKQQTLQNISPSETTIPVDSSGQAADTSASPSPSLPPMPSQAKQAHGTQPSEGVAEQTVTKQDGATTKDAHTTPQLPTPNTQNTTSSTLDSNQAQVPQLPNINSIKTESSEQIATTPEKLETTPVTEVKKDTQTTTTIPAPVPALPQPTAPVPVTQTKEQPVSTIPPSPQIDTKQAEKTNNTQQATPIPNLSDDKTQNIPSKDIAKPSQEDKSQTITRPASEIKTIEPPPPTPPAKEANNTQIAPAQATQATLPSKAQSTITQDAISTKGKTRSNISTKSQAHEGPTKQIAHTDDKQVNKSPPSPELSKFLQDETQMLLLPNDDMVLGKLTKQATIDQMDIYSYIKIVEKQVNRASRLSQRKAIDNFIQNYDYNFEKAPKKKTSNIALELAFNAVKQDNLFVLRTLIDNYAILQNKGEHNNTLLHEAAQDNNYYLTQYLIMRGINLTAVDADNQTALQIADDEQNNAISCILRKAGAR